MSTTRRSKKDIDRFVGKIGEDEVNKSVARVFIIDSILNSASNEERC